ncbi:MAG: type II secretion system protein N, partial [Noviherbaspirillum sp.]
AQAEIRPEAAGVLFGGRAGAVAVASNYQLKGVIFSGDPHDSVAILSADGKPAQAIRVDKEVAPGVTVKEVHRDYVLLSENGATKRVELPESAKGQTSLATIAPVPVQPRSPVPAPQPVPQVQQVPQAAPAASVAPPQAAMPPISPQISPPTAPVVPKSAPPSSVAVTPPPSVPIPPVASPAPFVPPPAAPAAVVPQPSISPAVPAPLTVPEGAPLQSR